MPSSSIAPLSAPQAVEPSVDTPPRREPEQVIRSTVVDRVTFSEAARDSGAETQAITQASEAQGAELNRAVAAYVAASQGLSRTDE